MYSLNEYQLNEHYQNLLREANNERLARRARANRRPSRPAYGPLLAELGRQLARLGESLQAKHDAQPGLEYEA